MEESNHEREIRLLLAIHNLTNQLNEHVAEHGQHFRICKKCEKVAKISDFYKINGKARSECKTCFSVRTKEYNNTPTGRSVRAGVNARRHKSPNGAEKVRAWNRVNKLVKRGSLPPANTLNCISCGRTADHYHHHNGYSREYREDVIPMCVHCHAKEHYPDE